MSRVTFALAMLGIILAVTLGILIWTQGIAVGTPPADKQAFVETEQALRATRENLPRATKETPKALAASCLTNLASGDGIFDFRFGPFPRGNFFANYAAVTSDNIQYQIYAGAIADVSWPADRPLPLYGLPTPLGSREDLAHQGLVRVLKQPVDPCASQLTPSSSSGVKDYWYPVGPLAITAIEKNSISLSFKGQNIDRFDVLTGQFNQFIPTSTPVQPSNRPTPLQKLYP